MNKPKKILLVSSSAGTGHKRAAEAIRLTCNKLYPDIEACHIDLIDYSNGLIKKTASGYNFLARHMPNIYGIIYDSSDTTVAAKFLNYFSSIFKINTKKLNRYVQQMNPDRIICTNFLASPFLKSFAGSIPIDMLITDYELNRVVLDPKVRHFFAPAAEITNDILKLKRSVFTTGIPIHPEFYKTKNLSDSSDHFNLINGRPTILIMSGGTGLADAVSSVKQVLRLELPLNLVVISGRANRRLFNRYSRLSSPPNINYRLIDFTDKIDELMSLASIIITKPGGLTVTESMYLKKPLLLINPIPGQEEANVKYIEKNNYGRLVTDHNEIPELITSILAGKLTFSEPDLPPNAAEKILELSLKD